MAANKVFIVEDDAVIVRAVAAHLTTWQMQVQCAGNFEKITEVSFRFSTTSPHSIEWLVSLLP